MYENQLKLFNQLETLVTTNEAFFSKVIPLDDKYYKVYNYRLASYSDFLLPGARYSRGILFEVDSSGSTMIRVACSMPPKFFNYNENPLSMNLDISNDNVDCIMTKMDGSIISTFMHNGELRLKSKTSFESDHVIMAMKYLNAPENAQLKAELTDLTKMNLSVHMELTSPTLRIVLGYPTERLTILYITDNLDPTAWTPYWNNPGASGIGHTLRSHWVNRWSTGAILPNGSINTKEYIDSIKGQVGMEGIVVRYNNGEMTKHKTDWYCVLHTTKDSISCPRHLFECIMNEAVDDLKAMLAADELTIARIVEMENMVIPKFNHMIQTVENFYNENKELSRKDYAIKARGIDDGLFGLKMNLYIGTTNNYREYAIKHSEMFVKDEVQLTPDNYE